MGDLKESLLDDFIQDQSKQEPKSQKNGQPGVIVNKGTTLEQIIRNNSSYHNEKIVNTKNEE